MSRNLKVLVLPALALLLAGAALATQNVTAGTADVPAVTETQPAAQAAQASPKMITEWQETGNVRGGSPSPTKPPVHPIKP